jgi:hypothetical protein
MHKKIVAFQPLKWLRKVAKRISGFVSKAEKLQSVKTTWKTAIARETSTLGVNVVLYMALLQNPYNLACLNFTKDSIIRTSYEV